VGGGDGVAYFLQRPADSVSSPRERIEQACLLFGEALVARWCAGLLCREVAYDDPDRPPLAWLGGPHADQELSRGRLEERRQDYWPRVWAARGLLYAWCADASEVVVGSLDDRAWRVREMAAKVVRRREIGQAGGALTVLAGDEVPRVRVAALRALARVGEAEHAEAVTRARGDPDVAVRSAAQAAFDAMEERLDRRL